MPHTTDIHPLSTFTEADFKRLITGYTSAESFKADSSESDDRIVLSLERIVWSEPYVKTWSFDTETFDTYCRYLDQGVSLGASTNNELVGIAIVEERKWNRDLKVWEIHVDENYRGRGIGRRLLDNLMEVAKKRGLRGIVLETQSTNAPAIDFYRSVGFKVEALDLTLYAHDPDCREEAAVFMKKIV
jgi:ribosomal protein S18 acetylase RimI-like enzyme